MRELNLIPRQSYTIEHLLEQIKEANPFISAQRARWIIYELTHKGYLTHIDKKTYLYEPHLYEYNDSTETFNVIKEELFNSFPEIKFCLFETRQFNEWLNLLIMNNMIIVEVESGLEALVFYHLQDYFHYNKMILLDPDEEMISRYAQNNLIIIKKLFSRAPLNSKTHVMTLEQLMVDILVDKTFKSILGGGTDDIIQGLHKSYDIDVETLRNYARRRRCDKELLKVWEGQSD